MSRTPAHDEEREREVLALFERIDVDPSARDEVVLRFQPLVEYLARRFDGRGEAHEDLVQVANIGLLNAVDRFDPERGVPFASYAALTVVGELKRHFRDKGWAVRVPRRLQETGLRLNRVLPELTQELGRSPTIGEIARRLEVGQDEVIEAMEAAHAYRATSIDAPVGESGLTPAESLGEDDETLELLEGWAAVGPGVKALAPRERTVLYLRFFRDMTQSEIAKEIGVSQMHVSRILTQTLARLREQAEGPPAPEA